MTNLQYDANLVMGKIQVAYEREVQRMKRQRDEELQKANDDELLRQVAWDAFVKKCRKPKAEEYAMWLMPYLMKEGSEIDIVIPECLEDTSVVPDYWMVNDDGAKITRLYGSSALRIIVPQEREVSLQKNTKGEVDIGENYVYYCKDATIFAPTVTRPKVQVFLDVRNVVGAAAAMMKLGQN